MMPPSNAVLRPLPHATTFSPNFKNPPNTFVCTENNVLGTKVAAAINPSLNFVPFSATASKKFVIVSNIQSRCLITSAVMATTNAVMAAPIRTNGDNTRAVPPIMKAAIRNAIAAKNPATHANASRPLPVATAQNADPAANIAAKNAVTGQAAARVTLVNRTRNAPIATEAAESAAIHAAPVESVAFLTMLNTPTIAIPAATMNPTFAPSTIPTITKAAKAADAKLIAPVRPPSPSSPEKTITIPPTTCSKPLMPSVISTIGEFAPSIAIDTAAKMNMRRPKIANMLKKRVVMRVRMLLCLPIILLLITPILL